MLHVQILIIALTLTLQIHQIAAMFLQIHVLDHVAWLGYAVQQKLQQDAACQELCLDVEEAELQAAIANAID
jgi:hypothetical protein